jgi:hypothetical protein
MSLQGSAIAQDWSTNILRIDSVNRNSRKFERLLHSLIRNKSTLASNSTMAKRRSSIELTNPSRFSDINSLKKVDFVSYLPLFWHLREKSVRK